MNCPACGRELKEKNVNDLVVDVCNGCGGIWFDNFELKKVDEQHERSGEELLDIEYDESVKVDHSQKRSCPKCESQKMVKHFFSAKKEIEIDECYNCRGIWLDKGELSRIRKQFANEKEREKALESLFNDSIKPQLEKMHKESEANLESSRNIAKMLKFLCPSYYIPGKQDGGAF